MQPHISYLILASPRSGSTLLCEAMRNTGIAGNPDEHLGGMWGIKNYESYFAELFKRGTTRNGVFGVKVMMNYFFKFLHKIKQLSNFRDTNISAPELLSFAFPNLHYIWIIRRDKIRQSVSHWKAKQTGHYIFNESRHYLKKPRFNYDEIAGYIRGLKVREAIWKECFTFWDIKPFIVFYEDLVQNYEETALQVVKHLGVSMPENLQFGERRLIKQADELSERWVKRYKKCKQQYLKRWKRLS